MFALFAICSAYFCGQLAVDRGTQRCLRLLSTQYMPIIGQWRRCASRREVDCCPSRVMEPFGRFTLLGTLSIQ